MKLPKEVKAKIKSQSMAKGRLGQTLKAGEVMDAFEDASEAAVKVEKLANKQRFSSGREGLCTVIVNGMGFVHAISIPLDADEKKLPNALRDCTNAAILKSIEWRQVHYVPALAKTEKAAKMADEVLNK